MAWPVISVVLGLGLLLLAGDALVKGAVNLSLRLGIPAAIVGMTVVAFGTSAPELLVSVQAVLAGAPELALGNVVGSNIANVLLVLGLPALFATVSISGPGARRDLRIMLAASALFAVLVFLGPIRWPQALVLLSGLAWLLWDALRQAQAHRNGARPDAAAAPPLEQAEAGMSWLRIGLFTGFGILGLPIGASLLVDGSVAIAAVLGVSEVVIGLTLVAVGTSLPELATTLIAALRREAGVALGNVLGSNCFNLLGILGVAGLVGPIPVPPEVLSRDLWVMLGSSLVMGVLIYVGRPLGRWAGLGLLALYAGYLALLVFGVGR